MAVAISFLGLGEIRGIREGTIVLAFIVGVMIKLFRKVLTNNSAFISQRKDFLKG